jgi:hypothetical protein
MEETRVRSESRGSRPSHVKRSRGCALQESSSSGSRSYSSNSSSSWSSGRSFTSGSNISWANSTVHNEPNTAVEVEEVRAAPWYAMEEEAKQMGSSAAGNDFAEGANLDKEPEEECQSNSGQGSDMPKGKRRSTRKSKSRRMPNVVKNDQRDTEPI